MRSLVARPVVLMLLLSANGCDDDVDPVDVPFSAAKLQDADSGRPPPPKPSASASSTPPPPPPIVRASGIDACCAELTRRSSYGTEASQRLHRQAAGVCGRNAALVRQGKTTRSKALAAVRSSLLGGAPSQCR